MTKFIRARNEGQKQERFEEIKAAGRKIFDEKPYSEITISDIAQKLSWSRANLYKYVSTKEEIYLMICEEAREKYYNELKASYPVGCAYSEEVFAEIWSRIIADHSEYLRYYHLLSVFEENVSMEKLVEYKRAFYSDTDDIITIFSKNLALRFVSSQNLLHAVHYQAMGMYNAIVENRKIKEEMELLGYILPDMDFKRDLKDFILIYLSAEKQK